jgi:hypothetical protein
MQKKLISLILIVLFLVTAVMAGCSSGKAAITQDSTVAQEQATTETGEEELQTEETETTGSASITDEKVLFDFYNPASDWPKAVPLHTEMKVTSYERTENSMIASGYCKYDMVGINNFYTNARKEVGGGYPWEWAPDKESITEGSDQVFYFISEEGQSLTIKFAEVEEGVLKFEFDFKE